MTTSPEDRPLRVLVVDDHRSFADAVGIALRHESGLDFVGQAGSVTDGLSEIERSHADVVLLDWQLPDMDGVHGVELIAVAHPLVAVVMITGHASPQLERQAMAAGAAAFLSKEASMDQIAAALRRGVPPSQAVVDGGLP